MKTGQFSLKLTMAAVFWGSLLLPPHAAIASSVTGPVSAQKLSDFVRALSVDDLEGRAPGTAGETKTIAWLIRQYKALDLEPAGENGGWTQAVPLIHTKMGPARQLQIKTAYSAFGLQQNKDIYLTSLRPVDTITLMNAPMAFVGYGVSAPERGWDDFKGFDLKGKIAVFLVNDPDFAAASDEAVSGKFGGRAMTYYGRWTYKYEEAARRGAVAALIIHDTMAAGYGWNTVTAPAGEGYDIVRSSGDQPVALQGWLSADAARNLFAQAGLDLDDLKKQARRSDFKPVLLPDTFLSADLPLRYQKITSYNVLGRIKGKKRPDETIMFGAHWDAYGIGAADKEGRTIRSGAIDDGIGIAGVLELAHAFKRGPVPDRSLVFASWTAEERGLLGSSYYAEHPLYPLDKTVANFTIDVLQTAGRAKDVLLIGAGQNDLETALVKAARDQDRVVTPELLPERGLFFRADHLPFARRGVPVLLMMGMAGAYDLRSGGRPAGEKWLSDYMKCYHQTCDVWSPLLNFEGAAEDTDLLYKLGYDLAFSNNWPEWQPTSEFKAKRSVQK
ncbi:MAG: M28 family metallopeptidase [Zymomonas mobilis subsp. pomaceae]|uniref:Peptidase M28 n=1 Tax=Zymomonas mobilis subsp. pomaceae (strain ATCC 29192 / DSM 22645 / JCM 10191 / CCUG 17912 / NBRC 13757 / NCIMB 11200 / NRRL B-4491 / Barker I) TaxID=579138 RepID=F8ETC6_ZYMMT|nr:M28 family metallopeptidase [Zymomonas mobilis]AEI37951.1 peptidase M28 [Zymomonas mobilis subsp. pomaceae ATCC 29192]MDX5949319.1 M28 family metallopeptidase [Zymomonas mobilis subsp. pomaceae]GEB89674.1 peptidase [Zymomonas mobilis subsp. pomaceae]